MTHAERTQAAIRARIVELQNAQYDRAHAINEALKGFEKHLTGNIRSVSDYIALSNHQRVIIGQPDHIQELYVNSDEIEAAEKEAATRLKSVKAKKVNPKGKVR